MTQLPQWTLPDYNWQSTILRPFGLATPIAKTEEDILAMARNFALPGYSPEEIEAHVRAEIEDNARWPIFMNGRTARSYQVQLRWSLEAQTFPATSLPARNIPASVHISIKRIDKAPVHDWRHFQEIKNMLIGPEFEAVELYPAEDRVVDTANQYHLWAFGDVRMVAGLGFPVGLKQNHSGGGAVQRARKD